MSSYSSIRNTSHILHKYIMSFLFGGGSKCSCWTEKRTETDGTEPDSGAVDPMKIEMATAELDMITDVL